MAFVGNIFLGLGCAIGAGFCCGSYAVPLRLIVNPKKIQGLGSWKFENAWAEYCIGAILIAWILCGSFVNFNELTGSINLVPIGIFSGIAGLANLLFGLSVDKIGYSLSLAINPALVATFGTMLPLLIWNVKIFTTRTGGMIIAGVIIAVIALALIGYTGVHRDAETKAQIRKSKRESKALVPFPDRPYSYHDSVNDNRISLPTTKGSGDIPITPTPKKPRWISKKMQFGLIMIFCSGIGASLNNVSFIFGQRYAETVNETRPIVLSIFIWTLILTPMSLIALIYCIFLLFKNRSWKYYISLGPSHRPKDTPKLLLSHFLSISMGLIQFGGLMLYGLSAQQLGSLGTSVGFSIFLLSTVITGIIWGFAFGDWKFASRKTMLWLALSLSLLMIAIIVIAGALYLE